LNFSIEGFEFEMELELGLEEEGDFFNVSCFSLNTSFSFRRDFSFVYSTKASSEEDEYNLIWAFGLI
jgi:hypothetical protein